MEQLEKEFNQQLQWLADGEITNEDFLEWYKERIIFYGGKLPPVADDTITPPTAR